ncbi:MAG TPA: glucose-6-phosphate isomerase [Aquifex sp.]|nr:glucose-6-phosphate isomerase [Aquifex sp.]
MTVYINYHSPVRGDFSIDPQKVFNQPFTKYPKVVVEKIKETLPRFKERFSTMVVCGMGGSSLGAKTIDAFARAFNKSAHRLVFLDNIDPTLVKQTLDAIDWSDTVFCFVSKSGTTLETVVFLNLVLEELRKRNLSVEERVIFVGDRGKNFEGIAQSLGCAFFEIPSDVDGRFSVLTSTGLVPSFFADFDIDELWEGAREALRDQSEDGEPIRLAKFKMEHYLNGGRNISVMFAYGNYLFPFSFWYSQLWAESLGKGGKGQTPLKALGTVDQHSLVQLFREGPDDKVYQFVKAREIKWDAVLPEKTEIFDYIANKKVSEIFKALYEGTKEALIQTGRPVVSIELDRYSAFNLGYLFMLYMLTTVAAAQILGVNPFGQPGVELGKKIAREKLQKGL